MAQNERTQPNDDKMPVDKPGDSPAKNSPVKEPSSRGDVPERDPASKEPEHQAPTDSDTANRGHAEFGEPQATVDAANGNAATTPVGP